MSSTIRLTIEDIDKAFGGEESQACADGRRKFLEMFPSGVMEGIWDQAAMALILGSPLAPFVSQGVDLGILPDWPNVRYMYDRTARRTSSAAGAAALIAIRNPHAGSTPCIHRGKRCKTNRRRQGQCVFRCKHPQRGGDCILRECIACELYEAPQDKSAK